MDYKIGDRVVITNRSFGHNFNIGDTVEILEIRESGRHLRAKGEKETWSVSPLEIEPVASGLTSESVIGLITNYFAPSENEIKRREGHQQYFQSFQEQIKQCTEKVTDNIQSISHNYCYTIAMPNTEHFYFTNRPSQMDENEEQSIIEFYSLAEIVQQNPGVCFDGNGDMFSSKESLDSVFSRKDNLCSDRFNGYLSVDKLEYLGDTRMLDSWEIEQLPEWVIKRNLGR